MTPGVAVAVIVAFHGLVAHLVIASVVVSWIRSAHQTAASAEVPTPRPSADAAPNPKAAVR